MATHHHNEAERELSDYKKLLPKVFPLFKKVSVGLTCRDLFGCSG